jgi:hypothetical protein
MTTATGVIKSLGYTHIITDDPTIGDDKKEAAHLVQ